MNADCTVLSGSERCAGEYMLGVIGARGAYRRLELRAVGDEAGRRALQAAVADGHAAEAASSRWSRELEGRRVSPTIVEAVSVRGLDGAPALVRLKVDGADVDGPWVTIARGKPGAMVGPFSTGAPAAFTLDGHGYVHFDIAVCTDCGGVGVEVHAVEDGRLRRVLESFANAN